MNKLARAGACAVALLAALPALAAEPLRVCSADQDQPYTAVDGSGFEDRIAQALAAELGTSVERVPFSDPRYVVRDGIEKSTCDLMMGVDAGDPRLGTTQPYYRSSYVFLTREADALGIRDWSHAALKEKRLGVIPGTPAETMLRQIGRHSDSFRYLMSLGGNKSMRNRFVRYDVEKLVNDVANGTIDVAVVWAPAAARYVKASKVALSAVPVPDAQRSDGEPVRFSYETAIGVRKDNLALQQRLEAALPRIEPRIREVLDAEGLSRLVPTETTRLARRDGEKKEL